MTPFEKIRLRAARGCFRAAPFALAALSLGAAVARADTFEPNDTPAQATILPSNITLESFIGTAADMDYYRMQVTAAGSIRITLTSVPAEPLDYDMALYEDVGGELVFVAVSELPAGENELLEGTVQGAADLYVVVYGFDGAFTDSDSYLLRAEYPGGAGQPPTIAVTAPNGGESWAANSTQLITWTTTDPDTPSGNLSIALEYSTNGGTSFNQIATSLANDGNHQWTVPATATAQARVRATVSDGATSVQDVSNANFSITTQPGATHLLAVGSGAGTTPQNVTVPLSLENSVAVSGVQVEVAFDPLLLSFVQAQPAARANGSAIGAAVVGGNHVRLVQYFTGGGQITAGTGAIANLVFRCEGTQNGTSALTPSSALLSDPDGQPAGEITTQAGSISVTGGGGGNQPPTIQLTAPNGGEIWTAASSHNITWTANDPDTPAANLSIALSISTNGGTSYSSITTVNGTVNSFAWTAPATPSAQCLVRAIVDDGAAQATDVSNATFTITQIDPGGNLLSIGTGSGASGTQVVVPLTLTNTSAVKALQTDIAFDDAVLSFASGAIDPTRAAGFSFAALVQPNPEIVRVVLSITGAGSIAVGNGAVANLTFNLIGAGGTQSALTPSGTVLSDPDARALEVTNAAGSIAVTGGGGTGPTLRLFAMKNPGRTRSLQIFVHSTQPLLAAPTVSAGGANVPMTLVDPGDNVFSGTIALSGAVGNVQLTAQGASSGGTGNAALTVTF